MLMTYPARYFVQRERAMNKVDYKYEEEKVRSEKNSKYA